VDIFIRNNISILEGVFKTKAILIEMKLILGVGAKVRNALKHLYLSDIVLQGE